MTTPQDIIAGWEATAEQAGTAEGWDHLWWQANAGAELYTARGDLATARLFSAARRRAGARRFSASVQSLLDDRPDLAA